MEKNKLITIISAVVVVILVIVAFFVIKNNHVKEFTVSFQVDEKIVDTVKVKKGEKLEEPSNPVKEGYQFLGWYLENSKFDFSTKIQEDITLNAKFDEVKVTYTITLDVDGEFETLKTDSKGYLTEPTKPVKNGYTFDGWYLNGKKVDFSEPFTSDCTIIARFSKILSNVQPSEIKFVEVKEKEVKVVASKEENNSANVVAAVEVSSLLKSMMNGNSVTGISDEVEKALKEAIETGKTIEVLVTDNLVTEETVKEDALKVTNLVSNNTILGYYDIQVVVKVDDKVVGNITKLTNDIEVTISVPSSVSSPERGVEREYQVVRVHNGVAEFLDTKQNNDGTITFVTDSFSTYALTYKEEVMNVTDEIGLQKALSLKNIKTIHVINDIEIEKILEVDHDVVIDGNNKTIRFVNKDPYSYLKEEDGVPVFGNDNIILIKSGNVTIKDMKFGDSTDGVIIESGNVTLLGNIDFTGARYHGIDIFSGKDKEVKLDVSNAVIINEKEDQDPTIYVFASKALVIEKEGQFAKKYKTNYGEAYYLHETNMLVDGDNYIEYDGEDIIYAHEAQIAIQSFRPYDKVKVRIENIDLPKDANVELYLYESDETITLTQKEAADLFFGGEETFKIELDDDDYFYQTSSIRIEMDKDGTYCFDIVLYEVDSDSLEETVIDKTTVQYDSKILKNNRIKELMDSLPEYYEAYYTVDSLAEFKRVYDQADEYNREYVSIDCEENINALAPYLEEAIGKLVPRSTSEYEKIVEMLKDYEEIFNHSHIYANFDNFFYEVSELDFYQEDVLATEEAYMSAKNNLVLLNLDEVIQLAKQKIAEENYEAIYTEESRNALSVALDAAKILSEIPDVKINRKEEALEATGRLNSALQYLEENPALLSQLNGAIESAKLIVEDENYEITYTELSRENLDSALEIAQTLRWATITQQSEVDEAAANLNLAIANLEEVSE